MSKNKENHNQNDLKTNLGGGLNPQAPGTMPFGKINYIAMGLAILMIVLGFVLMAGPGSGVEQGFNPDIFSTRRIVVGPTIAFLGFFIMAFAIILPPLKKLFGKNR